MDTTWHGKLRCTKHLAESLLVLEVKKTGGVEIGAPFSF